MQILTGGASCPGTVATTPQLRSDFGVRIDPLADWFFGPKTWLGWGCFAFLGPRVASLRWGRPEADPIAFAGRWLEEYVPDYDPKRMGQETYRLLPGHNMFCRGGGQPTRAWIWSLSAPHHGRVWHVSRTGPKFLSKFVAMTPPVAVSNSTSRKKESAWREIFFFSPHVGA